MAAQETAGELTPEQKIEQKLFGDPEPAPGQEAAVEDADEVLEAEGDAFEGEEVEELAAGEDEAEADEAPEGEFFEYELNGKTYEVDADLRDALSQAEDYTQKTQQTADEQKALSVLRDQLTQDQQQYEFMDSVQGETAQIQNIDWQVGQLREYMRSNIDTLTGNELEKVRFQIDELSVQKDGIVQGIRTKYGEFQQASEQAREELRAKSTESLKARLPNWGPEADKQATDYGLTVGFSQDEIDSALDPRERQVLWEASEYRRLKAGTGKAVRKARKAPKITPKGRDARPKDVRRKISVRKRLNAEPDQKAKAKIIQEDIANRLGL